MQQYVTLIRPMHNARVPAANSQMIHDGMQEGGSALSSGTGITRVLDASWIQRR